MSAFDDVLAEVEEQPRFRVPVRLLLDADAYNRANTLQAELDDLLPQMALAKHDDSGDVTETSPLEAAQQLARELVELHGQHPPTEFVFEALDAETFSDLDATHPGERNMADDFWLHLMAASCVEPEGSTVEGWRRWRKRLSAGQFDHLRRMCEHTNLGLFDTRPTKPASVLASVSRARSGPQDNGESPVPGSLDA